MDTGKWRKTLPTLGIGSLFLFGSSVVYAQQAQQPLMTITTDQFTTAQKLNLSIYNPRLTLNQNGQFSVPMGFYVYSNYPAKITGYQLSIYHASDADNVQPLKIMRFNQVSPYEAIMWFGELDGEKTLSPNSEYKVVLEAKGENGRRDSVAPVYFETQGISRQTEQSDFTVYFAGSDTLINPTPKPAPSNTDSTTINVPKLEAGKLPGGWLNDTNAKINTKTQNNSSTHNNTTRQSQVSETLTLTGTSPSSLSEGTLQGQFKNSDDISGIQNNNQTLRNLVSETLTQTGMSPSSLNEGILRGQLKDSAEIPGFGLNRIEHQGIVASALDRTIVIQMAGLDDKQDVMLNGERLVVDNNGRAMREMILSPGEYAFNLSWTDEAGVVHHQQDKLIVEKENELFYVGLAEVTWAQNKVSGDGKSILEDADEHHYSGTGSWDGRVQFYLKGNMDDYRVTAHLDTTETKLKDAFGRIGDKDPRRFTRELDPQAYYPIYGDDSTVENDIDTQGRFYVKLEKGKNYALWGNYNTQMTGTAFSDFNRSLYGAKLYHESEATTKFGDTRSYGALFAATGETRGSHNEFASTGGSLYYLKFQRVTEGTLKLAVEYRDANTGRVKGTVTLTEGVDFEIDNFQGRILLTNPLPMTANSGTGSSIISGGSLLNGDNVWLVADYEYYSDGFDMDEQKVFGGRAYSWLGDHLRLGGSYVHEDQAAGESYELKGVDLIVRPLKGTHTHLEYAESDSSSSDIYVSTNGGLGFSKTTLGDKTRGSAWRIEQEADFSEYVEGDLPLLFKGYYSMKQAGFSSFSTAREHDLKEWGTELRYDFEKDKSGFLLGYTLEEERTLYKEKIARGQYFTQLNEKLKAAIELQDRREDSYNGAGETRETLAAVKAELDLFDGRDTAYIIQQLTLDKRGDVKDNNKTTLGYESQITENLALGAEVFASNRGGGGGVSASWDVNDRANVYTKVMNDIDSNAGRSITTTVGTNYKATSQMDLYSERQFTSEQAQRSTSDVYGVKYKPTESQTIEASYSTGQVNYRNAGTTTLTGNNDTKRDVYILGYGYKNDSFQLRNKVEYRWERGNAETIKQWVSTNRAKTTVSDNLSWLGQFDVAKTTGSSDADVVTNFTEAAIGLAYRPIDINNLNLFGKITYIRGVDPDDQLTASTTTNGTSYYSSNYDQKSWVLALEGVYEWNQHWSTAFKAAHRRGSLRYKGESNWYSSGASLYAARTNFNYADFEYQVEYRTLRTTTADDHKDGFVTSVYRNVGDNAKIGVGYNFTEYNDDLTRLNYKAKGWFINVVGSF